MSPLFLLTTGRKFFYSLQTRSLWFYRLIFFFEGGLKIDSSSNCTHMFYCLCMCMAKKHFYGSWIFFFQPICFGYILFIFINTKLFFCIKVLKYLFEFPLFFHIYTQHRNGFMCKFYSGIEKWINGVKNCTFLKLDNDDRHAIAVFYQ